MYHIVNKYDLAIDVNIQQIQFNFIRDQITRRGNNLLGNWRRSMRRDKFADASSD